MLVVMVSWGALTAPGFHAAMWVEPPTLANLFDEEREVQTRRRAPRPSPEGQGGR
jgi:hypothetical protein